MQDFFNSGTSKIKITAFAGLQDLLVMWVILI